MSTLENATLDGCVERAGRALIESEFPSPEVLFLLGTGLGSLPERIQSALEAPLSDIDELPRRWRAGTLCGGRLGGLRVWLMEDQSGEPGDAGEAPWVRGLPLWIAASLGASVCVHTSAGSALRKADGNSLAPGSFALTRDHVNLSGSSPLLGLGPSSLGPLFPDTSTLHHIGLRRAALENAERAGFEAAEAVVACVSGPQLETPAEGRMWAQLGADVAVQGLADPLISAAHAGLSVLSLVALLDRGGDATELPRLVEQAAELQPRLERLVGSLGDDLERAVRALEMESDR